MVVTTTGYPVLLGDLARGRLGEAMQGSVAWLEFFLVGPLTGPPGVGSGLGCVDSTLSGAGGPSCLFSALEYDSDP